MVDKSWIRATMDRVTKKYTPPKVAPLTYKDNFLKGEYAFDGDIPSKSEPNVTYHVSVKFDGTATCTCKGFRYNHSCWHILSVKEALKSL